MSAFDKLNYIERRTMGDNMHPYEFVRQVMITFGAFNLGGDASWPLRTIYDIAIGYVRSLSAKYHRMTDDEQVYLTKLFLFEACYRTAMSLEGNEYGLRRQDYIIV